MNKNNKNLKKGEKNSYKKKIKAFAFFFKKCSISYNNFFILLLSLFIILEELIFLV